MNASNPVNGWFRALPGLGRFGHEPVGRLDLIGLDMTPTRRAAQHKVSVPVIAAFVIAALFLVGLRIDVMRMRYASAQANTLESQLLDEKRNITVSLLRLREPKLLADRAAELGFAKPDRVINLPALSKPETHPVSAGARP